MTTAPRFPLAGYALAAGVVIGLAATSLSAFAAFDSVMTFEHALAAALVVEAGAVVEAWALARGKGFWDIALALLAVALSVWVSAKYNYAQVAMAGAFVGVTAPDMLNALAYGPLAALVFFSLNFGRTVRRHDAEISEYEKAKTQAAETITATEARRAEQRAYDEQAATRRAATMAHELELARIAQAASPQYAMGGGKAQPATRKPQRKAATQNNWQRVAEWRAENPNGAQVQCAKDLELSAGTVSRKWEPNP